MAIKVPIVTEYSDRGMKAFQSSLKRMQTDFSAASGASSKFSVLTSGVMDSIKQNAGALAIAGGAALIAFGAKSVAAFQEVALSAGKLRDSLGVTAEEASRLQEVAEDLGIGTETLSRSIGIMNRMAANTPASFAAIGAELVKNADGTTNVNETFLSTVDALNRIPDATARAAAAQRVFGRSWMEMAELIELGSSGVREAMASVEEGKIIDDAEVQNAREFRDALDALKGVAEEIAISVGGRLVPTLTDAAAGIVVIREAIDDLPDVPGWARPAADAIGMITNPLKMVTDTLGKIGDEFGDAEESTTLFAESTQLVGDSIADAVVELRQAESASRVYGTSVDLVADSIDAALQAQEDFTDAVAEANTELLEAADSSLNYRNQQADTGAAISAANAIMDDGTASVEAQAQAMRDAEAAALASASAALRLAEDQAAANGTTLGAVEKNRILRTELSNLAQYMTGPARDAILGLVDSLGEASGDGTAGGEEIGEAIASGIATGISSGAEIVKGAAGGIVGKALAAARTAGEIKSPSRLFAEEVGKPISAGIAEGIAEDAEKISSSLEKAIESAEESAVKAAEQVVDKASDALDGFWKGLDTDRSVDDMKASIADAADSLAASDAAVAAARAALELAASDEERAKATKDLTSAEAARVTAVERLEEANYRLAKATADSILVDEMSRESWRQTALAAGMTVVEIDGIIAAYMRLVEAKAAAAAEADAIRAEAVAAQNVRSRFDGAIAAGLISGDQLTHLSGQNSGSQVNIMKEYLNNLDRLFGALPQYANGGVTPGRPDQAMLAVLHGGEEITPARERGRAGGLVVNFYGPVDSSRNVVRDVQTALWSRGSR